MHGCKWYSLPHSDRECVDSDVHAIGGIKDACDHGDGSGQAHGGHPVHSPHRHRRVKPWPPRRPSACLSSTERLMPTTCHGLLGTEASKAADLPWGPPYIYALLSRLLRPRIPEQLPLGMPVKALLKRNIRLVLSGQPAFWCEGQEAGEPMTSVSLIRSKV